MAAVYKDWTKLRDEITVALKTSIGSLTDSAVADIDGPIRNASNRLTSAIRANKPELVAEIKDELAVRLDTIGVRAKGGAGGALDFAIGVGMNFLFNGAIAALNSVRLA